MRARWRRHSFALAALAACACATGGGGPATGPLAPAADGAHAYFAPLEAGAAEASVTDPLQRALLDTVAAAARARGEQPPALDPRLGAVAVALAGALGDGGVPDIELQEFLLSHYGLGEPAPRIVIKQVAASDEAIRAQLAQELPGVLARARSRAWPSAVVRRWFQRSVVVALQRVEVEMLPVPRQLPAGDSALLGGRLLGELRDPQALVALPRGDVRELPVRGGGGSFQASLRCDDGPGRYQVEIVGTGPAGKDAVAIFPVYCGVDPPAGFARPAATPEPRDPRGAEALLLDLVTRDRAQVGAPPLVWDEALAQVARAHSQDMAARAAVGHHSPLTGDAADRLRRARVRALLILENVARASSVAEAQRSFMSSPGHRANVISRQATRLGIGVVVHPEPGGAPTLYVTELLAR
jgi:hypothetical protein